MVDSTYATIYDILFSLTLTEDRNLVDAILNKLKDSDILDTDEKTALFNFENLYNEINGIPSSGTLVSRDIAFQNARVIQADCIEDITKIFIINKKKMNISSVLTNASMDLTKPGANLDIIAERVSNAIVKYNPKEIDDNKVYTTNFEQIKNKLHEVTEEVRGIKFGIDVIDQVYPGITPKSYNIIAGYAGSFKTTLALNACYIGMRDGFNTCYISLEVSKDDVMINLMTTHCYQSMNESITRNEMTKLRYKDPEKFDRILNSLMELPGKIEVFDEEDIETYSTTTFDEVIRKTDKMFHEKFNSELHHIVLDHAQLLKFDKGKVSDNPYMIVNFYASYFRQKAAKDGYAVTVLSQTSRGGYEYACKHGGQYQLTGLAEGNELERGATFVMTLFSNDSLLASGQIQCQILKNRYGEKMLDPQPIVIKPEYYFLGSGYSSTPQQVDSVFNDNGSFENPFETGKEDTDDLDSLLGGMM